MTQEPFTLIARTAYYNPEYVGEKIAEAIKKNPLSSEIRDQENLAENLARLGKSGTLGSFYLEVERTWTVGATLLINLRHDSSDRHENLRISNCHFEATVGWLSTIRSVASAQASVRLYQEMIDLAALITSIAEYHEHTAFITEMPEAVVAS